MEGDASDAEDRRFWLALSRIQGIGVRTAEYLIRITGSLAALFHSTESELVASGVKPALARALQQPDWRAVDHACDWLEAAPDRTTLQVTASHYPDYLRQIPDPPLVLFVQGQPGALTRPQIGIVGSRNPTPDGIGIAADFAARLSRAGLTITSGMALGIDAAAHQGAMQAGGSTVAVAGCGPDRVYPKAHARLAEGIRENGALVSEFFPGTPPLAGNFPRRNRIISGLCTGVMVVEAALRSGSLITARYAAEQGREVFAIPGSIHSPQARGCHRLIKQGAKLVETEQDVLEELRFMTTLDCMTGQPEVAAEQTLQVDDLSTDSTQILKLMGSAAVSVDRLVERSGLTADAVSSILLLLELRGLVASQPGGTYSRLRRDNT